MFRHTLATELRDKGVEDWKIAQILGDSVEVIRKHYFHFTEETQKGITDALKKIWN
jgi:integrase